MQHLEPLLKMLHRSVSKNTIAKLGLAFAELPITLQYK